MFSILLSGDATVVVASDSRAQLPLLLSGVPNLTTTTIGIASEGDTALPIIATLSGAAVFQVGQASEDDTALPMVVVTQAAFFVQVGQASEEDTALAIVAVGSGDAIVQVGQASETDTAFSITYEQTFLSSHLDSLAALTPAVDAVLTLTPVVVE